MRLIFIYIFSIALLNCSLKAQQHPGPKVGVVLSGGGAKGYAHIGALKVIEKAGVKIDYIGGTSIGAIVGALYASGYSADELEEIMYSLDLNSMILNNKSRSELPFFDKTYREKYILELPFDNFKLGFPNALSSGQGTAEELTYLFRHVHNITDFNELPIPFVCVATRLSDGESIVFHEGYLPQVVLASSAYPTLFDPVRIKGQLYTDGGVKNNYPVQEVLDMGADYIIGIDIQEGLMDQDNLNSATKIIEQIISYNIIEKSAEQSKKVDLSIEPNMHGFSVTSFDKKDEIIGEGTVAAEEVWEQLTQIAKEQGNLNLEHSPIETKDYSLITNLTINGLSTYNKAYVIGKLGIIPPQLVSFKTIRKGINALYSTGNFNKVYYRVKDSDDGHKKLSVFIQEKPNHQYLKFGLHYDDLFKTGLLLNFTAKHLLFENSILSADLILGDFPRYELNYYIDNSIFPSLGFNFGYKQFNSNAKISNFTDQYADVSFNYKFDELINKVYIQSTLFDKYAIGGGLEHQYLSIKTNNLPTTDPYRQIENSYFLKLYGTIKADNLNNPNFPTNGIKLNADFKYLFASNSNNFSKTSVLTTKFQVNKSITKWFSIQGFGEFGTFLNDNPPISQYFTLGGFVEQDFINYSRFYGLPFFSASGQNLLVVGGKLQAKVLRNHYFSAFANYANLAEDFEDLQIVKYRFSGYGLGYGYDSPLGPIIGMWTYSPTTKSGLFNVSLGFWF